MRGGNWFGGGGTSGSNGTRGKEKGGGGIKRGRGFTGMEWGMKVGGIKGEEAQWGLGKLVTRVEGL